MPDKSKRIIFGQSDGPRGASGSDKPSSRRIIGQSRPEPPPEEDAPPAEGDGDQAGQEAQPTTSRALRPEREGAPQPSEERLLRAEANRGRLRPVGTGPDSDSQPKRRPVAQDPEAFAALQARRDAAGDPFRLPRWAGLVGSLALCAFMAHCYAKRPNELAAITVFPAWVWAVPGLLLLTPAWIKHGRWLALAMTVVWVGYGLAFMDGLGSAIRGTYTSWPTKEWLAARDRGLGIRVVSLNCKEHSYESAKEVRHFDPDIVLLQECPKFDEVKALALDLFGSTAGIAYGYDATIIARGRAKPRQLDKDFRRFMAQAEVTLPNGLKLDVVSLRLVPALVRVDLWNPETWKLQRENRELRIQQIQSIAELVGKSSSSRPMILGGDFNATQGDPVYNHVRAPLRDAFYSAGIGWGGTYSTKAPLLRLEHVFVTPQLRPATVVARNAIHSDHLILVCDLIIGEGGAGKAPRATPGTSSRGPGPLSIKGPTRRRREPPPLSPSRTSGAAPRLTGPRRTASPGKAEPNEWPEE